MNPAIAYRNAQEIQMDDNTFEDIAETSVATAIVLAHAFCACNGDFDQLFACLRLLDRLHGRAGGHYSGWLDGCHFQSWVFEQRMTQWLERYREHAYAWLDNIDSDSHFRGVRFSG